MPNNLRLTGGRYVSKDGNDANAGTDPNLPKATPAYYAANEAQVIGSGAYKGAFNLSTNGTNSYNADSLVVLNATGNMVAGSFALNQFTNVNSLVGSGFTHFLLNTFTFSNVNYQGGIRFNNSILQNGIFLTNSGGFGLTLTELNKSVAVGITFNISGTTKHAFNYSQIFNSTINSNATNDVFDSSYIDAATTIVLPTVYFSNPSTQLKNCNIQGKLNVNGVLYELKKDKAGNAIDPNPAFLDLVTIDATVYDRGNFSQNPEHQDLSKGNYWAVDSTSPNLFADSTGLGSIGSVFKAITFKATSTEFASPVSNDGLIDSGGDIIYSSSLGERLSQPLFFSSVKRVVKRSIGYGGLAFNSSEVIGGAENESVVVPEVYLTGTAGRNPQRVNVVLFRFTDGALPVVDADWNNGNKTGTTAGQFIEMQVTNTGLDLRIDNSGNGTGSPSFDPLSASNIALTWGQIKLVIKEGI